MKSILYYVVVAAGMGLVLSGTVLGQEVRGAVNHVTLSKGDNSANPGDITGMRTARSRTPEEISILQELQALKRRDDGTQREKILSLQNQLDQLTGESVTKPADYNPGRLVPGDLREYPLNPTDIQNVLLYNSGVNAIHGLATATEQRGITAGRIWAAVAHDSGAGSDRVQILRSDNGGLSWGIYAVGTLGGTDQISYDQLDMEIVEPDTGQKYIYVFYGFRQNGGSGNWLAAGLAVQSPTFGGGFFGLSWPGASADQRFYRPRVTSDNAFYHSNAYLYIVASSDSATSTGRDNFQVYARVLNPYTVSPTFSYMSGRFFWHTTTAGSSLRDLHSDVAYFKNGGSDSVIVSYSNLPDSTRLFFAKASIAGTAANPTAAGGSIGGNEPNDAKQFARLSTNGSDNGSVICVFNQFTNGSWNVKYFRTINSGNFYFIDGQSTLWGNAGRTSYQPDIVGVRNGNIHYFCFETFSPTSTDSLHYVSVTTTGGTSHIPRMNGVANISETQGPKPGFRYVTGDSCFAIYSPTGPVNAWATAGCTGSLVSVPDEAAPGVYSLSQNYPNPFNPRTRIQMEIPKSGHVRLALYDVLGREVAVLVNDRREAGTYSVEADGSHLASGIYFYRMQVVSEGSVFFSATKKMVILK